jgi:hypothetical protein
MTASSPDTVLHLVARLSAVGACLGSLELLLHALPLRRLAPAGRPLYPVEKAAQWGSGGWHLGLPALVAVRFVLGALLLADPGIGLYWKYYVVGLLLVSVLVSLLLSVTQGADWQLTAITHCAMALTLFSDTLVAAGYCLWFLTLQLCLAYFAAGFHKLRSAAWRNGSALPGILSGRVFGFPAFGTWLGRHPLLAWSLCWGTIVWEVSFPVVLVAPRPACLGYLACGVLFHLGTAFTMGLNKFIWAFFALYPAALYCTVGPVSFSPWGHTF